MLILAASVCAVVWLVRFIQQITRVHAQRQLMNFTIPSGTVVLSALHDDEQQLITNLGYHRIPLTPFDSSTSTPLIVRFPPPGLIWAPSDACVFLHGLRVKNGPWRLVSITLQRAPPFTPNAKESCGLAALVQAPATLQIGSRLQPIGAYSFVQPLLSIPTTQPLRVFAGQPDPADDSHFTIRYEVDGNSQLIDGWLMPDDTVKLEPRPQPH